MDGLSSSIIQTHFVILKYDCPILNSLGFS